VAEHRRGSDGDTRRTTVLRGGGEQVERLTVDGGQATPARDCQRPAATITATATSADVETSRSSARCAIAPAVSSPSCAT